MYVRLWPSFLIKRNSTLERIRYYDNWCGHGLQYLDDAKCAKKFPNIPDRNWICPIAAYTDIPSVDGYVSDSDVTLDKGYQYMQKLPVDTTSLSPFVTNGANLCLIVTKRVTLEGQNTHTLYNKYFCAGEASRINSYETWSSSKIFAMANAAGHLRTNETQCQEVPIVPGLDSSVVESKHGKIPLGDLATIVCSYDETAGYSSNSRKHWISSFLL